MIFDEPSYQDELNEEFELAKLNLEFADDLIPVWIEVFAHRDLYGSKIYDLKQLTTELLQISWGQDAWAEVNFDAGMIYYKHKDGREISRLIAF